jgi:hypothetical protein
MQNSCRHCAQQFEITDEDLNFYDKISPTIAGKKYPVTPPTLCPDCRQRRRFSFRNENALSKRRCDLCGKGMVSFYKEKEQFPVYCVDCWWSDKWDPFVYGRDFDFNRKFFPQFQELMMQVPKAGMLTLSNENSEFNSLLAYSKNTYMSPGSYYMEDCYYTRKSQHCKDCLNSNFLDNCELTSDSVNCRNCYNCHKLVNCRNCSDSRYLADCIGCKNCFLCSGLANKEFHYKNLPVSKEEIEKIKKEASDRDQQEIAKEFAEFNKTIPKKYQNQINCTDSNGDYIQNCKNAQECYDCFDIADGKYMVECVSIKDSMDLSCHDEKVELCCELCSGGEKSYNLHFSYCCCDCVNSQYLNSCFFLEDSFGCDSIHSKSQYCILNKKYSSEEYSKLKAKIIEHMIKTGEWGEFFPPELSPFNLNQTVGQIYQPLSKEQALKYGYRWQDAASADYKPATVSLADNVQKTPDSITNEILACAQCGKNYRIIAQELKLSKKLDVPLSKFCTECRQQNLMKLKNPRKLYPRACAKCKAEIRTTYSPDRPEMVYCESCYLKAIY